MKREKSSNGLTRRERLYIIRRYLESCDYAAKIDITLCGHVNKEWIRIWIKNGYSVEELKEHLLQSGYETTNTLEFFVAANLCQGVFLFWGSTGTRCGTYGI